MDLGNNSVDDNGTDLADARAMLDAFCKKGFDGDEQKAAVVLGRPASELREMLTAKRRSTRTSK